MIKQKKYYPPYLKIFLTVTLSLLLVVAAFLYFYLNNYRYITYELDNGTKAAFAGRVDEDGVPYDGSAKMPDGEEIVFEKGVMIRANGDRYVGEIKDLKYHGSGSITFASGDTYTGTFDMGKIVGSGVYTFWGGDRFEGDISSGKKNGYGVYTWADGSTYAGEYKSD